MMNQKNNVYMKKLFIVGLFLFMTFLGHSQLQYKLDYKPIKVERSVALVKVNLNTVPLNLHLKKDNGPKKTATFVYLGLNGIVSLNQFTSPPNVQKELMPAYIGTIALTSVAFALFLILN